MKRRKNGAYRYDQDSAQSLSDEVVEILAASTPDTDVVAQVLSAVCRRFRIACGFVYELDHDGVFRLRDSFSGAAPVAILPRSFRFEAGQSIRDLSQMLAEPAIFQDADIPVPPNAVLIKPVPGDDGRPVGLVGMTDRRRALLRSRPALGTTRTILSLLANCVRVRMRHRRPRAD